MTINEETRAQLASYRAQLQAVEMCKAYSAGNFAATHAMYEAEAANGRLEELMAALAQFAVTMARTVESKDPTMPEAAIWDGLTTRATTALAATVEIDKLTNPTEEQE